MATTDLDKLRVLLPHWIEHNAEHADEFRLWAEKAQSSGRADVAEQIALAAKQLDWVNEALNTAMEKIALQR